MRKTTRWISGGILGAAAIAAAAAALGAGTANADGLATGSPVRTASAEPSTDSETPITGDALAAASAAALATVPGGTVTDTEIGDEEGYYEIEVTLTDGRQVDVHLDEAFTLLATIPDGDGSGDTGN